MCNGLQWQKLSNQYRYNPYYILSSGLQKGYLQIYLLNILDDCKNNPCMNGGSCIDGVNSHVCTCKAGFTGKNCQININECGSSPCLNGATCVDEINNYSCVCLKGFEGKDCQVDRGSIYFNTKKLSRYIPT